MNLKNGLQVKCLTDAWIDLLSAYFMMQARIRMRYKN